MPFSLVHAQATPTCSIQVSPNSITLGGTVVVTWTSQNAATGNISHIGDVGLNGSANILPSSAAQTVFAGTFVGPGGTANCSATVSVGSGGTGSGTGSSYSSTGYDTSGTYTGGNKYSSTKYEPTPYTIDPSALQTPTNSTFTPSSGGGSPSSGSAGGTQPPNGVVPCGYPAAGT